MIEGSTGCINCPTGQYSMIEGSTGCINYPIGHYSASVGKIYTLY
jgi:hypothetical protein